MASGGGATSSADMVAHQKNFHSLILLGRDAEAAKNDWAASDVGGVIEIDNYDTNPSVLSFLFNEGLTAAGGNPFEGVSAYDPADELGTMETAVDLFDTETSAVTETGDWLSFLLAAQTQMDNQIPGIDVETLINDAVASALGHALASSMGMWAEAKAAGDDVVSSVSSSADGDIETIYSRDETAALSTANSYIDSAQDPFATIEADAGTKTAGALLSAVNHALSSSGLHAAIRADNEEDMRSAVDNLEGTVRSAALNAAQEIIPIAESDALAIAVAQVDEAKTVATSAMDIVDDIDPQVYGTIAESVTSALQHAGSVIQQAMATALATVDDSLLDKVISAYRRRQLQTHMRSVNRFAGGMADINAVNGSAFVIGMALLEQDFNQSVSDYQTQITLQLSQLGVTQFSQVFSEVSRSYMDAYKDRFTGKLGVFSQISQLHERMFLSSVPNYITTYMQGLGKFIDMTETKPGAPMQVGLRMIQDYMQGYKDLISGEVQSAATFGNLEGMKLEAAQRVVAGKLLAYNEKVKSGLAAFDRGIATQLQIFEQALGSRIDGDIRTYLSDTSEKSTFVRDGIRAMEAAQSLKLDARKAVMAAIIDLEARKIVAGVDEYDRNLELDVRSATWDMELFQSAGNVLSSVTGSVVQNAMKPSKSASTIAGMGAGAAAGGELGLKMGTALGPHTAGVAAGLGAIVGGLAGALS